jgi:nucleoside-diphosphate kinase
MPLETTFALIKTGAMQRRQDSAILWAATGAGLHIDLYTIPLDAFAFPAHAAIFEELYREHHGRHYYADLIESVRGPTRAIAFSGWNAISLWRELLGPTDPAKARLLHPNTIRARFGGTDGVMADNAAHGSDSPESAARELAIFYPKLA